MADNVPGMLYVTMEPQEGLSLDQFHEWYNNEHGPTRLRLPQIFTNGLRYQATDGQQPTFLAAYDVTSMSHLETPTYLTLRANRSPREAETIGQVDVVRHFLDLVATKQSEEFVPIEEIPDEEAEGLVLVSVQVELREGVDEKEVIRWYEEEHLEMLAKVPGWLRSRVYRTPSVIENGVSGHAVKIVTLHDYAKENGLGGEEHTASMSTPWRDAIFAKYVTAKTRRTYELFYTFGPAPRELGALSRVASSSSIAGMSIDGALLSRSMSTTSFTALDGSLATIADASGDAVITSTIYAPDGLAIPYRLEGNTSPKAPTVAFANSLLTSLHMWDPLVAILKKERPDLRILRFDTRGRHVCPAKGATLEILADDLATLLNALRVTKLRALVGVSMGGATTLRFALRHPSRLEKFIACDFNASSSATNTQAWKDRTAVAESDNGEGIKTQLAPVTVSRWFHPHTMAEKKDVVEWMTKMVGENSVQGFRYGCQALWEYDMREEMRSCTVKGLFVVGEGDAGGALVKAMDGFKGNLGAEGAELKIVPLTGHLPMCEAPEEVWAAVEGFL
ncbi:Alpha/Beta hydrolase protein [Podospora didyma]|uniref:Alpha/Beta hydrolase protein n=1 Tax=Podospora didyma TaxID=330526 RepID=A0AAE0NUH3_9PEZI|nr:Alpha/Beta hydrolase protein [Podospora didyma]